MLYGIETSLQAYFLASLFRKLAAFPGNHPSDVRGSKAEQWHAVSRDEKV
jgi:hypothetical protein